MRKDRVAAFTDAVLAIIMTILVLELKKPESLTIEALWNLRFSFFSYALSFFWLGSMWINIHNEWESIDRINSKTLWIVLLLLFFCSMIPYATDLVSGDFSNKLAQGFYGVFVILVTLANIALSVVLQEENSHNAKPTDVMKKRRTLLWIDVGIKIVGLMIALTVYPPAMMLSVIVSAGMLMIGIRVFKLDWDHMEA